MSESRKRGGTTRVLALGRAIRAERLNQGIGLRELCRRTGISPTYLSRVETGHELSPPAEEKIVAIAEELGLNPDALLGLAGRVRSDLVAKICERPVYFASLIREER